MRQLVQVNVFLAQDLLFDILYVCLLASITFFCGKRDTDEICVLEMLLRFMYTQSCLYHDF